MAVDTATFRSLFGSFPTAVTVVTAVDAEGVPRGFTCNAISAVSAEPPLLLVCADRRSQTLPALLHARSFVVNVLAEGAEETALVFAGRSERKFAGLAWRPSALAGGAPVLDGALAHAECVVTQVLEAGDHWVFIARVEGAECFARRPVLYHRGTFSVWASPEDELAAAPR
ncbi:flavin reductase family protein [Streptomyces sp. NPDC048182]|uniref:flavin reductase family protein n=1 Tax=unclassified Streptomyces TaxID=2593676 RepID=UPI0033B8A910